MKQIVNYITPAVTPLMPAGQNMDKAEKSTERAETGTGGPAYTIDFESCEKLYNHLIDGGVDGILVLGSIGEFFGLTVEQKKELIAYAVKCASKRVQVIAGTTSMIFDEIVELSNYALEVGADGVMVIPPYYFHFTDESVLAYYDELAQKVNGPLYLYNFPDRTGYEISPAVVRALAEKHENIVGIKDTIGGVDHTRQLIKAVKPVRPDFLIYSGFDDNFAHNVLCGGNGCIAGLSNLYPQLTSSWAKAARQGDFEKLQQVQQEIDKLMDIYAVGKPFVPFIKEAMAMKGIIKHSTATKPMPEATEVQKSQLKAIMERYEATL